MQQLRLIIHHLQRGLSGRKIALELGLSRNTVKLYTDRIEKCPFPVNELQKLDDGALSAIAYPSLERLAQAPRRSDLTTHIPDFLEDLKGTGVTRRLLWEEYKKKSPEGYAYTQFCELLSREQKLNSATMHFDYQPGELLLVEALLQSRTLRQGETLAVRGEPLPFLVLVEEGVAYLKVDKLRLDQGALAAFPATAVAA